MDIRFPETWSPIPREHAAKLESELRRELVPSHAALKHAIEFYEAKALDVLSG